MSEKRKFHTQVNINEIEACQVKSQEIEKRMDFNFTGITEVNRVKSEGYQKKAHLFVTEF